MTGSKKPVDDPLDPDLVPFESRIDTQRNPLPHPKDAHKPRRMADTQRSPPRIPDGTFGHCHRTSGYCRKVSKPAK